MAELSLLPAVRRPDKDALSWPTAPPAAIRSPTERIRHALHVAQVLDRALAR
jgi:hypothetical protein